MDINHIKKALKIFLLHSFRVKDIAYSDNLFETGAMHSLFFIQLLVFIEKKYKIDIEVGEFDTNKLTNIDEISQFIFSKL